MPDYESAEHTNFESFQPENGHLNKRLRLFLINYNDDDKIHWYQSNNTEVRFLVGWKLYETEILFLEMVSGSPKYHDELLMIEIAFAFIFEENPELIEKELIFFTNEFYEKLKSGQILNGCSISAIEKNEKMIGFKIERFQLPRQRIPNTATFKLHK